MLLRAQHNFPRPVPRVVVGGRPRMHRRKRWGGSMVVRGRVLCVHGLLRRSQQRPRRDVRHARILRLGMGVLVGVRGGVGYGVRGFA